MITAAALVLLAACGADADTASDSAAGGGGGGGPQLQITSPSDGDSVDGTFMVEWEASEQLGEPETGLHHVHIFVDGNEEDYTVVGNNEFEISGLSSGEHTVGVTLQHADHSPAGAEDEISVNVGEGGGGADEPAEPAPGGGYDY